MSMHFYIYLKSLFLFIGMLLYTCSFAQKRDTLKRPITDFYQDIIEDFVQNNEADEDFDFNTWFDELEYFQKHPINLNRVTKEELRELRLLTDLQVNNLLSYRKQLGDLVTLYELQAIPGFTEETIRRILPFVKVKGDLDDVQSSIGQMLSQGKNELFLRWTYRPEDDAYTDFWEENGRDSFPFIGDNQKYYVRYRHSYENKLSYGFTAEKDNGEEFFKGSNKQGFDFYSAHLFLKNYNKTIKAIAIGDYAVSMGQGLLIYSGFARGKSSDVIGIRRNANILRAYTSVNESLFMRGAGATLNFADKWDLTVFGSRQVRDGNLVNLAESDFDFDGLGFSSLQTSGLHRTLNEIEDEDVLGHNILGANLKYDNDQFHIGVNALYNQFDSLFIRRYQVYNQFDFRGDKLFNISADYSYIYKNFNFFGETAVSQNGGLATLNGVIAGLDRTIDVAILHRYFQRDFQVIDSNPFSETRNANNENGLYLGLEVNPNYNWGFKAYFDIWKHPWLRFATDSPSGGYEYLTRLTYRQKRKMEAYIQYRAEIKERNASDATAAIDYIVPRTRASLRFHFASTITKEIDLRSRAELSFFDNSIDAPSKGYLIYQDIIYKPKEFPLSFTARYSLFNTDNYDTRIYTYENSILNEFIVPGLYDKGTRAYINLRYKGIRNLTLELRYARTRWQDRNFYEGRITYLDTGEVREITLQTRTEWKAQVKYKF